MRRAKRPAAKMARPLPKLRLNNPKMPPERKRSPSRNASARLALKRRRKPMQKLKPLLMTLRHQTKQASLKKSRKRGQRARPLRNRLQSALPKQQRRRLKKLRLKRQLQAKARLLQKRNPAMTQLTAKASLGAAGGSAPLARKNRRAQLLIDMHKGSAKTNGRALFRISSNPAFASDAPLHPSGNPRGLGHISLTQGFHVKSRSAQC